jgi:hypothetical protein
MTSFPIVSQFEPSGSLGIDGRLDAIAESVRQESPYLAIDEQFRPFIAARLPSAPALHLDDLSEIPLLDRSYDVQFLQERARLRAGTGDLVASCFTSGDVFDEYCRERLRLGEPTWHHPRVGSNPLGVAYACWEDRETRRAIIRALRSEDLLYIHPHMGVLSVWELCTLLRRASRREIKVIAPPPGLTKLVNDKLAFAEIVVSVLGPEFVPRTAEASNFAMLSQRVRELAGESRRVALKLPDSAGGGGTIVLESERFRSGTLQAIRKTLREELEGLDWEGESKLLVACWETDVLCSPSAQLWIPPREEGPPVVEGIFVQALEGIERSFAGSRPAHLSRKIEQLIADGSWQLASLFQRLGYVGRCSFDTLLLDGPRVRFVECNGRWGGTSTPMMLMNRLFGDWTSRAYAARECRAARLDRVSFAELLSFFDDDLYDADSGRGRLVFWNPGRMQAHSGINVIALGDTWEEAARRVSEDVPSRLAELVNCAAGSS